MAKILLIDDDENVRTLLREIFTEQGTEVQEARDGIDGALAAGRWLPDAVVVDADMPRLDGHGLCQRLRENAATAGIPILMLTGTNNLEAAIAGLAKGADDHMTKPFDVNEVAARVTALLLGRR
jgi:DNA-binding response OmpR family regulator